MDLGQTRVALFSRENLLSGAPTRVALKSVKETALTDHLGAL